MRLTQSTPTVTNRSEIYTHGHDERGFFVTCAVRIEECRPPFFRPTVAERNFTYREGDYTEVAVCFKPGRVIHVHEQS